MGYFNKYERKGIDFMDNRTKGELSDLSTLAEFYIEDYGYIHTDKGECAVFCVRSIDDMFYFGNSILLEILHGVDEDGEKERLLNTAVSVEKVTNRNGNRSYWKWTFHEN